ncbi:MAG: carboxymuconolactone decarboxylase family protein [Dehalococcoidia bacterium]
MLGKKAGLSDAEVIGARRGSSQQPKLNALVKFVGASLQPQARVSDDQLNAVRAAGYTDTQITEVLLVIAQTVFTNLFNRVHQTKLDFPPAASL